VKKRKGRRLKEEQVRQKKRKEDKKSGKESKKPVDQDDHRSGRENRGPQDLKLPTATQIEKKGNPSEVNHREDEKKGERINNSCTTAQKYFKLIIGSKGRGAKRGLRMKVQLVRVYKRRRADFRNSDPTRKKQHH